jgi:hypothetical protein
MVVGAANDQYLFDVSVRVQYSEDAAVVAAALRELEQVLASARAGGSRRKIG